MTKNTIVNNNTYMYTIWQLPDAHITLSTNGWNGLRQKSSSTNTLQNVIIGILGLEEFSPTTSPYKNQYFVTGFIDACVFSMQINTSSNSNSTYQSEDIYSNIFTASNNDLFIL